MTTPPRPPDVDQIAVVHLRMVLEALLEVAEDADKAAAGLPAGGVPLGDLAGLLADVDDVAVVLAGVREQVEARARDARGWTRNRAAWPDDGLRAERTSSSKRTWDVPAGAGRLAPLLVVDPDTGEVDVDVSAATSEVLIRRFLRFAAVSGYRSTALGEAGVEYDDLLTVERGPVHVKVHRVDPGVR